MEALKLSRDADLFLFHLCFVLFYHLKRKNVEKNLKKSLNLPKSIDSTGSPHSSAASYVVLRLLKWGEIENWKLNIFQIKFVLPQHDGTVFAGDSY